MPSTFVPSGRFLFAGLPDAAGLSPSTLLDGARLAADLQAALGEQASRLQVLAIECCGSTNALLADSAFLHNLQKTAGGAAGSGVLLVADRQTAGRGRRGRAWHSSPAGGLTFSLRWAMPRGVDLCGLSLATGVVLRHALASCGVPGVLLKWPNDLVIDAASSHSPSGGAMTARPRPPFSKVGGILIETVIQGGDIAAIIGVGLNLHAPVDQRIDQPAAGLDSVADPLPDRSALLAAVASGLVGMLLAFPRSGFAPWRAEWESANAHAGLAVVLHPEQGPNLTGICRGVDEQGALRVGTDDGEMRWIAGDVSLRAMAKSVP